MSISTLGYAILGLLVREPLSGYDVASLMKQRIRYFWSARHSQIYPELAKLEAAGLVTHDVIAQDGRPDKKVYSVTKRGRDVLAAWAAEPLERSPVRDEVLLKVYCGHVVPPAVLARNLETLAASLERDLAAFEELQRMLAERYATEITSTRSAKFFGWATLEFGVGSVRHYAAWCRRLASRLAGGEVAPAPRGRTRARR